MTQTTVYWELFFPAIVWPRLTRPIVLAVAVPLHVGIGLCLGMWTFGLAMLIGCSSFIPPSFVRALFDRQHSGDDEERTSAPVRPSRKANGRERAASTTR